ncbi:MAG: uridine kinase [Chloroflexi bacterium]|nr:uridine kinase [Chloroflexota bacterium]
MKTITMGVAGGTGSGKTTVARRILERVGFDRVAYVPHDAYYRDVSDLPPAERGQLNFDHPDSLDNDLLIVHLQELQAGRAVEIPVYDFKTHSRVAETRHVDPQPVILVEGILIFADKRLRDLMNVKIFVDTDADIRLIRRLQRDISERGRSAESVINQYLRTVRPMHLEFAEPSKRYADVIIPEGGFNEVAIEMVAARLRALIEEAKE